MEDFLHYQTSKKIVLRNRRNKTITPEVQNLPACASGHSGESLKNFAFFQTNRDLFKYISTRLLYLFSFIKPLKYSSVSFSWCQYHPEETFKLKITENSLTKYHFRTKATGKTRTITNDDDDTDIRIPSVE